MDFENRDFVTEYRGNYVPKKFTFVKSHGTPQEFKNPLTEGFKHYLTTGEGNEEKKTENCHNYLDRLVKTNEKLKKKYFKEQLNTDLIDKTATDGKKTQYIHDFCSFEGHEKYLKVVKDERVPLPEGWIEGCSTHRWYYRNPIILFPNIYKTRYPPKIPPCETDGMKKHRLERKNVSELSGTIGELGTFILENQMHGEVDKINFSEQI